MDKRFCAFGNDGEALKYVHNLDTSFLFWKSVTKMNHTQIPTWLASLPRSAQAGSGWLRSGSLTYLRRRSACVQFTLNPLSQICCYASATATLGRSPTLGVGRDVWTT